MLSIAFASFSLGRCPVSELLRPFQITERVLKINISFITIYFLKLITLKPSSNLHAIIT